MINLFRFAKNVNLEDNAYQGGILSKRTKGRERYFIASSQLILVRDFNILHFNHEA